MTELRGRSYSVPFAYALGVIVGVGVERIEDFPAVDHVYLRDGRLVVHWKGAGDADCGWEVRPAGAHAGAHTVHRESRA